MIEKLLAADYKPACGLSVVESESLQTAKSKVSNQLSRRTCLCAPHG